MTYAIMVFLYQNTVIYYVLRNLVFAFCCFYAAVAHSNSAAINEIKKLSKTNPQAAIDMALSVWDNKNIGKNREVGVELIKAYLAVNENVKANNLIKSYLQLNNNTPLQLASLISFRHLYLNAEKDWSQFEQLKLQTEKVIKQLSKEIGQKNKSAITNLLSLLGQSYFNQQKYSQAEATYIKSLDLIPVEDIDERISVYENIRSSRLGQGKYAGALEYMLKSVQLSERYEKKLNSLQLLNMGALYFMIEDFQQSLIFSKKALELEDLSVKSQIRVNSNIGAALIEQKKLEEAEQYLLKAVEIALNSGMSTGSPRNNLGNLYQRLRQFELALEQLQLSEKAYLKENNYGNMAIPIKTQADVYLDIGQNKIAAKKYEQALDLYLKYEMKPKLVELYPKMIANLETLSDYKRAVELMHKYKQLSDTLINVESNTKISELENAYELEKKSSALLESELLRGKQEKSINTLISKQKLNNKIKILLLSLLIGLISIVYLFYRLWKFRGKANSLLLEKNNQIRGQHGELKKLNNQLKNLSEVDYLTSLKNRHYLNSFINKLIDQKSEKQWSLILIDIDDFKQINDKLGHDNGDMVLQAFSQRLEKTLGPNDIVVRWGGEEFLLLISFNKVEQVTSWCEQLLKEIYMPLQLKQNVLTITCSIGFIRFPIFNLNNEDWEVALKLADTAMYEAKEKGKNRWEGFEVVREPSSDDVKLDSQSLIKSQFIKRIDK